MSWRRLYDRALRLAARDVWTSHRADALDLFDDLYRDARRRGRRATTRFLARSFLRLLERPPRPAARRISASRHSPESAHMTNLLRDVHLTLRGLSQRPAFAVTIVAILAVGIGATTTIWSVVDAVLLRRLPYPEAERLVYFDEGSHRGPDFSEWREGLGSFAALAAAWSGSVDLVGGGTPEQVQVARVSPAFFDLFGAGTALGRELEEADFAADAAVAIIDHRLWQRRWGADPSVLGRQVRLDGRPTTIVGIVDPDFDPPPAVHGSKVDVWVPLRLQHGVLQDRRVHVLTVFGRLAPGVDLTAAQGEVDALRERQAEAHPEIYRGDDGTVHRVPLVPLRDSMVNEVRELLAMLLGAVGLLLAIACVDVAILLLARGTQRRREMALRGALGASRLRLSAQLLTESLVLGLLGGVGGWGLAHLGVQLFTRFQPGDLPRIDTVAIDLRVLAFCLAISLATGIVFGLLPALQSARVDASSTLKDGSSAAPGRGRIRGALVVAEVALALTLLMGAGVLMRSLVAMLRVEPGFDTGGLLTFSLTPGSWGEDSTYSKEQRIRLVDELRRELAALPGVESVTAGWGLPFVYTGGNRCCWQANVLNDEGKELIPAIHPVAEDYFATLRAPLVAGRALTRRDAERTPTPAVLERGTAEALFADRSPLGQELLLGSKKDRLVVVGLVDGVHHWGLAQEVGEAVYVPYERFGGGLPGIQVAVRTSVDPLSLVPAARELVATLDPELPIDEVATMENRVGRSLAAPRFLSGLLAAFAAAALFLAVGGIYSSMSYWVSQRRRELGIRVAVGALRRDLVSLVVRHGLLLAGLGLAVGAALALAGGRWLESLVWGVSPTDPATLAAAMAVLAAAAVLACLAPAVRAAHVDPVKVLRAE